MNNPVSVAYGYFHFGTGGIEIEYIYEDETRKKVPRPSAALDVSLERRSQFRHEVDLAVAYVCRDLGIDDRASLPIAFTCLPSWRETVVRALDAAGCPEFALLSPEAAESVHFFERYELRLTPVIARWIARGRDVAMSVDAAASALRELELARDALVNRTMSVAVVGAMKAGKSTFINALLGDFIMPAIDKRCTRRRFVVSNQDEVGEEGRRITVTRLGDDGTPVHDPVLSVDADACGWSSANILSYLFALNAPDLLKPGAELGRSEQKWLAEYRRLPLPVAQREALDSVLASDVPIDTIRVTHPFHALTREVVGRVEIWDTPGPDGITEHDGLEQRLTDRVHFEQALREASAAILIFDVMRNRGEAQDRVLSDIATFRGQRASSLVFLANRVDERPHSGVLPLDEQLEEIREDVRRRHGLVLRPIVPLSARHAQYAREMLRAKRTGLRNEERWEDLESAIRVSDTRANPECPELAVEARSRIRDVEALLHRFFRQEHGLSILQGACDKVGRIALEHERATERNLQALRVQRDVLARAVKVLTDGTVLFGTILGGATQRFEAGSADTRKIAERVLQTARDACSRSMAAFWNGEFGSNQRMLPRHYEQSSARAMTILEPDLLKARAELEEGCDAQIAARARSLWSELDAVVQSIEGDIDRQLGIKGAGLTPRTALNTDFATTGAAPPLTPTTRTYKAPGAAKTGAKFGLGAGLALGLGVLLTAATGGLATPVLIAAGAAAAATATGTAVGAGVGHVFAATVTERFYARNDVLATYQLAIETMFQKMRANVVDQIGHAFARAEREISFDAQAKLASLRNILADAERHFGEQTRAGRIEYLENDLASIRIDVAIVRDVGRRLGVDLADQRPALGAS